MPKFKLKDYKRKDGKQTIYLHFYYDGNHYPLIYNTKINIFSRYWDQKKERVKSSVEVNSVELNKQLNRIEEKIVSIHGSVGRRIEHKELKELLQKSLKGNNVLDGKSFIEFAKEDNKRLSYNTQRTWNSTVSALEKFEKEVFGKITFENIDLNNFYKQFKDYCFNVLNYKDSTFSGRIGHIKTILANAEEQGIKVNQAYKGKSFKKLSSTSHSEYLNEKEIRIILDHDFSEEPMMEYIRDIFCLRCYVGTRFSDSDLSNANIVKEGGERLLKIVNYKTEETSYVPIHPVVDTIMAKYDWNLKSVGINHVNRSVKYICRKSGLTNKVEFFQKKGGEKSKVIKEKWELISTHTARRSVATNMYLAGVNLKLIQTITGHSTLEQLLSYIKADKLDDALLAAKSSFFKG